MICRTCVLEKPFKSGDTARSTYQARMKADRHHGRLAFALSPESVEGVDAILSKILRVHEITTSHIAHIICIEGVRHNYVAAAHNLDHVGQVIIIGV